VPRVFDLIFSEIGKRQKGVNITVKVSFLELYNEEFHDLLDPASFSNGRKKEILLREEKNGHVYVQGVREDTVESA